MRTIVNALLIRKGMVLLARRSPQRKSYANLWSFPGGHVEKDESLKEALVRELREEVGVLPTRYTHLGSIADPNGTPDDPITYHMYAVSTWLGEPAILDQEHTELRWLDLSAASSLPTLALQEYRALFREIAADLRTLGQATASTP